MKSTWFNLSVSLPAAAIQSNFGRCFLSFETSNKFLYYYAVCWSHTFTFSKGTSHEAVTDYNKHQGRVQRRNQRQNFYSTPSPDQLCKPTNSTSRPIRWQHTQPQWGDDQASVPIAQMMNKWGNWCRRSLLTNLKKVVACSSEMLVPTYQSIRWHISEDRISNTWRSHLQSPYYFNWAVIGHKHNMACRVYRLSTGILFFLKAFRRVRIASNRPARFYIKEDFEGFPRSPILLDTECESHTRYIRSVRTQITALISLLQYLILARLSKKFSAIPHIPVLRHANSIHILATYFVKINFSITLPIRTTSVT